MIIMDFAKGFDKVPHRSLLYKLDYYVIRGSTHKCITSWLSERFQKVMLDGQASGPVPVLSGVPQGSVLGQVLFLIFINDLPENIRSSVRLFADDCVLYRSIESPMDCQILQDDLKSLAQWEIDWQMKFNVAKCHSMRVTPPPDKHMQFDYTLHQQRLEQVQSAKYLGTLRMLHTKDWFVLSSSMQHLLGIPIMKLDGGHVEKVQMTAASWTCRRWRNTSSVGDMVDELEWPSLETRREQSSLTFIYKIHSGIVSLDKD